MAGHLNIVQEKSRLRALVNAFWAVVIAYAVFWILSAACFGLLDTMAHFKLAGLDKSGQINWRKFWFNPFYVWQAYEIWWGVLVKSLRLMTLKPVLFVPFAAPVGMVVLLAVWLAKKNYSFSLWYVLNYHFARVKDVEHMGLNKGMFMVLGRIARTILSVRSAESVLCIGEMGTGKTSGVAIPSILRSDNACIVAVDTTGLLPKYTAGHRATLGDVVYYNWDLTDDKEKGVFYPRWNPFADENMPKKNSRKRGLFETDCRLSDRCR